ncbi:MAG: SDR family oxidoreductase [Solirubrobacterales bacterium]|nr:SDR family oxidoreductase [Solirubrobacterales bacterium]MBV9048601.1 SDR family oxidoreductase [Solirubrobacterales bacterium]
MTVAIAGGHGKIALRLTRRLSERGERVLALIRNPDHADDVRAQGGQPVICDLEIAAASEVAEVVAGSDAVVFAAGAGPGSGAERKLTMDRDGATKLLDAARTADVARYLMISAVGAENPPAGDEGFSVYLRAKAEADDAVRASGLEWTIVRPGGLTDDPGRGRVRIDSAPFRGRIPRDDVAAVLDALLLRRDAGQRILYVNGGNDPIEQALDNQLH